MRVKKKKTEKSRKKQKNAINTPFAVPGIRGKQSEREDTYKQLPRGRVFKESGVVAKKTSRLLREKRHDEKLPNLHEDYSQRARKPRQRNVFFRIKNVFHTRKNVFSKPPNPSGRSL